MSSAGCSLLLLGVLAAVVVAQDQCTFARDSGDNSCGAPGGQKFFYDTRSQHCQPFYYKGCGGSANRFDTRDACEARCIKNGPPPTPAPSGGHGGGATRATCAGGNVAANDRAGPLSCDKCPSGYICENGLCCGTKEATCNVNYDAGRFPLVGSHIPMYFYNPKYKNCMLFTYYGSEGNPNNFPNYNDCKKFCSGF